MRKLKKPWAYFAAALVLTGSAALADMNTEEFVEFSNGTQESEMIALVYLTAAFSAFQVANIELKERGLPQLFCDEEAGPPTEWQMSNWISDKLKFVQLPAGSDVPVTIVLHEALMENYPCNQ